MSPVAGARPVRAGRAAGALGNPTVACMRDTTRECYAEIVATSRTNVHSIGAPWRKGLLLLQVQPVLRRLAALLRLPGQLHSALRPVLWPAVRRTDRLQPAL